MRTSLQDFAQAAVVFVFSLLVGGVASAAVPTLDAQSDIQLDSQPHITSNRADTSGPRITSNRAADSGPHLDKPIRAVRTVPIARARTENANAWVSYWKQELKKTSDPAQRLAIQFQIDSIEQARPYLNAKLKQPRPLDPAASELPAFTQSKTDRDADSALRASAVDLSKRIHKSQQ